MSTLSQLAEHLTVSTDALERLGITRNGRAWLIPERNADGEVVGTAKRFDNDSKGFIEGGHRGLTLAWPLDEYDGATPDLPILIVEGMTCAAAGMSLGFPTVGRPSATSCKYLPELLKGRHVAIIGENDGTVGASAAWRVAEGLVPVCASVRVIFPPSGVKDLRAWSRIAIAQDIHDVLDTAHVLQPGPTADAGPAEDAAPADGKAVVDKQTKPRPRALHMRLGNTIDDSGTEYLWARRFAMSSLNVIFSRPGHGKSTLAARMVGHVTNGSDWPDGAPCERGFCLYLKGEGTDRSVNDRMRLAGADPSMYGVIGRAVGAGQAMIDLSTDAGCVGDLIREHPGTRLVIVDTLDAMFPSMRMIDNAHIRQCLYPLQSLAERYGFCVLLLAHTNKGGYTDPIDRLSGGRAIGGAARSLWYLGKLDREDDEHFLTWTKVNDFLPAPAIGYQIVGLSADQPGAIRWGETREDVNAWDLDQPRKAGDGSKAEQCQTWLSELLAGGPVATNTANSKATTMNFGRRVMTTARAELGAKSRPAKGVAPPEYFLCLPGQNPPDTRVHTSDPACTSPTDP